MNESKGVFTLIRAGHLIDGNGGPPLERGAILLQNDTIKDVGTWESVLPPENLHIEIYTTGPNERHFHFKATGDRYNSLLNHLVSTIREQLPRVLTGDGTQ